MKITFDYTLTKFNTSGYIKNFNVELTQKLKEAVGAWISAAVTVIPVWSGASHGTFIPLANKIGQTFSLGGHVPWLTGPPYGMARSGGNLVVGGGTFSAEYSTTLWHLIYNEYNNANANPEAAHLYARLLSPGPYAFQEKANTAFMAYAKTVRLPSPMAYLTLIHKRV